MVPAWRPGEPLIALPGHHKARSVCRRCGRPIYAMGDAGEIDIDIGDDAGDVIIDDDGAADVCGDCCIEIGVQCSDCPTDETPAKYLLTITSSYYEGGVHPVVDWGETDWLYMCGVSFTSEPNFNVSLTLPQTVGDACDYNLVEDVSFCSQSCLSDYTYTNEGDVTRTFDKRHSWVQITSSTTCNVDVHLGFSGSALWSDGKVWTYAQCCSCDQPHLGKPLGVSGTLTGGSCMGGWSGALTYTGDHYGCHDHILGGYATVVPVAS